MSESVEQAYSVIVTCQACNGTGKLHAAQAQSLRDAGANYAASLVERKAKGRACDQCDGFGKRMGQPWEARL